MKTQLNVRLEEEIKQKFDELARRKKQTTSDLLRELISNYVRKHDIEGYIDELWDQIGSDLKSKGYTMKDVEDVIEDSRQTPS